ncbi:hypothetical protein [Geitlerinema calcuttense]|uniref:Carboxypeptidase regulatory-like domain-containing protein n=1 Tax=Geitlerinema calcuttense NRMC-F 0142 TaxID=2922238 RepID=A0ABT7LV65_9CYAN|nr:hypothetical protein [Geitlerinema calcuttense]MDL5055879.1 hypothetical protein [Geitlerinema calcuttense NRMC-F 0142]
MNFTLQQKICLIRHQIVIASFIILAAASLALGGEQPSACGAPQPIIGRAQTNFGKEIVGIYGSLLTLYLEGEPIAHTRSNPFGYFAFEPVLPCNTYQVAIRDKWFVYEAAVATVNPDDFTGHGAFVVFWVRAPE